MTIPHVAPLKALDARPFVRKLAQEAVELDDFHDGLVRHLGAWRNAHERTALRLGAVMARIDAILERIERRTG